MDRRPTYIDAVQRALLTATPDQRRAIARMSPEALASAVESFVATEAAREAVLNETAGMGTTFAPTHEVLATERIPVNYKADYDGIPWRVRELDAPRPSASECRTYALAFDIATRQPVRGDLLTTVAPRTVSKRGRTGEGRQRKYASNADRQRAYRERKRLERERRAAGRIDLTNV